MLKPFFTALFLSAAVQPALAAPFTLDDGCSISCSGVSGDATNSLFLGYSGTTSTPFWVGNGSVATATLNASGLLITFDQFYTNYAFFVASLFSRIECDVYFTPTVPNLSYEVSGFLDITKTGAPTSVTATSIIDLSQAVGLGVIHYSNTHTFHNSCHLWVPADQQLGTPTGDLVMGVPHRLRLSFGIFMTSSGDSTGRFASDGGAPYFQLKLIQRPCDSDLSGDGVVDDADFAIFAAGYDIFDCADPAMPPGCPADINHDGYVDDADFVAFAAAYDAILCP